MIVRDCFELSHGEVTRRKDAAHFGVLRQSGARLCFGLLGLELPGANPKRRRRFALPAHSK